jgi:UDP-N-acetylmuramyl pentapeptide phosphotransferase/UDP-N-acetylglucosamine-1-phosphate transferase
MSPASSVVWNAVIAMVATASLIGFALATGLAWKIMDRPNERSMHTRPTPRIGGACLMLAVLGCCLLLVGAQVWGIVVPAAGLALVSFLDDIYNLPAGLRWFFQFLAAAGIIYLFPPDLQFAIPLALAIVWVTNLYNFMDGIDGLAGGMTLFGFGFYAYAGWEAGDMTLAIMSALLAGAGLGFLLFNFPPSRIFMGDTGAIPLGFLAAVLGYYGYLRGDWAWWFPFLVFLPFLLDATVTLLRRLMRGQRIWQAHRLHFYQRMAQRLGHRPTTLSWYAAMAVTGGIGLATREMTLMIAMPLGLLTLGLGALSMFFIERLQPFPRS